MALRRALPSLTGLRTFEAVARHGSFRRAAAELNITESAVSHQIAALEASLDARLFTRMPGGAKLSASGEILFPFMREAFDQIENGTALLRRDQSEGGLTLQIYVTLAVRWLIPRLHRFRSAHPDIRLAIDSSLMEWDFVPKAADMGIVYAQAPKRAGMDYVLLMETHLVLVCSPGLGRKISAAKDLSKFTALEVSTAPGDLNDWFTGDRRGRPETVEKFDSYLLAIEAAIDGQGLMVAPELLVRSDLLARKLVQPMKMKIKQRGGWYLAYLSRRRNDRRIQAFRKWIDYEIRGGGESKS
jgi:LysR family transcriptional regulator, glycine cleavage system transcriptional activator